MIRVIILSSPRYKIDRERLGKQVEEFLEKKKVLAAEVGVNFVGRRKMKELNAQFRGEKKACCLLTFPLERGVRGGFVNPPDGILRLGDIVLCYPEIVKKAVEENVLLEEKIREFIEYGLKNLLG